MDKYQFLLSGGVIPSILVVLSWINNNARLNRLEAGLDATNRRLDADSASINAKVDELSNVTNAKIDALNRRMDDLVRGFHTDMMSFQASILESNYQLRERVTVVETKIAS